MLNIVTGRSGSGKTAYVCGVLNELARTGENKLLLIVPEQFSFAAERSVLSSLSPKEAQRIEVLSFTRLADYVHRSLGGLGGSVADEGSKIIIMLRALEGLQDKLSFYSAHIRSVPLAKKLIKLIGEFHREKVTPEMLSSAAKKAKLHTFAQKLSELSLIYSAFDAMFENRYFDGDTLPDRLCRSLCEHRFFEGYTIVIDSFKGFTSQELEIIKHLITQSKDVYITLCTEDIYSHDASMVFDFVNETASRIVRIAKESGVPVAVLSSEKTGVRTGARFKSKELAFLEKNVFSPAAEAFCYDGDEYEKEAPHDVCVFSAASLHDECNFVAASARRLMRTRGVRLRDMAVIVRNEDEYRNELLSAFRRFGIPVFEDARQPIINQPLIALCRAVLTVMFSGFSTENILNYIKTGLSPLSEYDADRLENYALMWALGAKSWRGDFTLNPNGMNSGLDSAAEKALNELNEMRRRIILPLCDLKEKLRDSEDSPLTAVKISEALYDFIVKTDVKSKLRELAVSFDSDGYTALALEQDRIWDILMETLDKLSSVYGDVPTAPRTYYNLFCAVISVTDLGSIPHGLDEITIGSADRIRLSSPEVVFVLGCAEGHFPASPQDLGLLTDSDRKNLLDLGIELSPVGSLAACEERYIAYTALTASSKWLFAGYHRTEGRGESLMPSIIIENLKALFKIDAELDTSLLSPEVFAETKESAFAAYASSYSSQNLPSLRRAVELCGEFDGKLAALDKIAANKPFMISDSKIASELFGKDMRLSASKVDVYHHCAFSYFCKYGLRARPREKAELSPAVSGTVIHYVLENIIKENGRDGLLALDEQGKKAVVDKWLSKYLDDCIGGFADKPSRFRYLYNRLAFALYDVVNRLCAEFSVSDFVPCDFELPIGDSDNGIESYTLRLENGGTLRISGSIDRVDKYEKDGKTYIRVVDYKSGGKEFVLSDILDGLNMQMLIYLFALWAGGQSRYGDVVPGGILYYPAKRSSVSLSSKREEPEEIEKKKRRDDRSNGLFLLDDVMLEAMEHGMENKFIPLTDRYGKLKGNLITLQNMSLLKQRIDSILTEMADALQGGKIPALPITGKRYENTCKYCDYSAVCGFENGEGREIRKFDNDKVFELLNKEGAK